MKGGGRLGKLDLKLKLDDRDEYHRSVDSYELRLLGLERALAESKRSVMIDFEGWEASGRGECIKRLTERLDPRGYVAYDGGGIATDEERGHMWLWRYAVKTPKRGQLVIFHRGWYTRVLDDRVEQRIGHAEARRSFDEINEFEKMQSDDGCIVVKLWLHISKKEQKRRFEHFERDPAQSWKVNADDWQEQRRYEKYQSAAEEMISRTDTPYAPWLLVECEDDRYGRVRVMQLVAERLEAELQPPAKKKGGRK